MTVSHSELLTLLNYDPDTGVFTWLPRPVSQKQDQSFNTLLAGTRAGTTCPRGYRQIVIHRQRYREHRLAWFYVTGEWPQADVDHKNLHRGDNRWSNLRLADETQNNANAHLRSHNKSGFKGVSFCSRTGRWRASATVRGKYYFLGRHDDPRKAHAAYVVAAKRHFGDFARFS